MNVYRYIGGKIRQGSDKSSRNDRMGAVSTTIGFVSVALSIAVIIIAICVVLGFRKEIRSKTSAFMGSVALVAPGQPPMNDRYPFTDSISFLGRLDSIPGVAYHQRTAYCAGLLKTSDNIFGVHFKGVDSLYNFSFFQENLTGGAVPQYSGRISSDIMLAQRLARQMGCDVGDQITAYFIDDEVKVRKFTVRGMFDAQLENLDNALVICDIRQVQRLNGWEIDEISAIEIMLDDKTDIDTGHNRVSELVYEESLEEDPALLTTSVKQQFPNLFDWLSLLDFNVVAILLLMIVVAGFNMISSLLIILFRNISSIGLLKAMGMTSSGVSKVFRHIALNIVGKGLVAGTALAVALCAVQKWFKVITLDPENYFVKYVPIEFNVWYILLANVLSLVLIMLILSLTSRFVAGVSPDKTMRAA
ncbi:MAG: ABC transporter permease [Bacteroidales bacterium]|nr:ABC transporter permease [Bacteroidales bacterium]